MGRLATTRRMGLALDRAYEDHDAATSAGPRGTRRPTRGRRRGPAQHLHRARRRARPAAPVPLRRDRYPGRVRRRALRGRRGPAAVFTGLVLALRINVLVRFGSENMVGTLVALSLTRELTPVLAAIMVTARDGSAMAATIGNMAVTGRSTRSNRWRPIRRDTWSSRGCSEPWSHCRC